MPASSLPGWCGAACASLWSASAIFPHLRRRNGWKGWYRRVVYDGICGATAVTAPSRWMLENVGRYFVRPASSSVVYNGRSPLLFNPHMTKESVVLSVGRLWDGGKQVSLLLDREQVVPVWIAGDPEHP